MRVLAAMSGGVDSAVAAALAVDAGHDVTGVHMALSRNPGTLRTGSRGCCTVEDAFDARRVCDLLGIPYYVWDFSDDFIEDVVADFLVRVLRRAAPPTPACGATRRSSSPPCWTAAIALGFDAVATGHHVRLRDGVLHRSRRLAKDQSYVLAVLTADQLAHSMFPLGELTKQQVRAEAARRGFAVAGQARLVRHLLHPGRRHPRLPGRQARRPNGFRGRRASPARCSASTTGPSPSPSASARV